LIFFRSEDPAEQGKCNDNAEVVNFALKSLHTSNSQDHHVSCEDLLDFAVDKPIEDVRNGNRKLNTDSDEVRVMQKVLANEV